MTLRILFIQAMLIGICLPASGQVGPNVHVQTDLGSFVVLLDSVQAPGTAVNFMRYVDSGHYNGGMFYRTVSMTNQPHDSVKIEVIQGGIDPSRRDASFPPIRLERTDTTGILHRDGTISMARSTPHSATWSFFICIGDQPELDFGGARNPDGQGFAAFGRVVQGLDVVRKIQRSAAQGQNLTPPVGIRSMARTLFVSDSLGR